MLFEWSPELRAVLDEARELDGDVSSMVIVSNTRGQRYTSNGLGTMWKKAIVKAMDGGGLEQRYTFRDIRGKTGSEAEDERLLGHMETRTLRRHYQRAPVRVTPLKPRLLER